MGGGGGIKSLVIPCGPERWGCYKVVYIQTCTDQVLLGWDHCNNMVWWDPCCVLDRCVHGYYMYMHAPPFDAAAPQAKSVKIPVGVCIVCTLSCQGLFEMVSFVSRSYLHEMDRWCYQWPSRPESCNYHNEWPLQRLPYNFIPGSRFLAKAPHLWYHNKARPSLHNASWLKETGKNDRHFTCQSARKNLPPENAISSTFRRPGQDRFALYKGHLTWKPATWGSSLVLSLPVGPSLSLSLTLPGPLNTAAQDWTHEKKILPKWPNK